MSLPKTYYLDPLFDLFLGGYPFDKVRRSSSEMSVLFYACCSKSDTLILDCDVPEDYAFYLSDTGLCRPANIIRKKSADLPQSTGIPWGWSAHAAERLRGCNAACDMPDWEIVKKVNNRRFCNQLGIHHSFGVPGSFFCESETALDKARAKLNTTFPLVIKPAFGGSGFGMKVVHSESEMYAQMTHIRNCIDHGGFVLEPWCKRVCDLSTNCIIKKDGSIDLVRHQRLFSNDFGAFFGIYCAPVDPALDKWSDELERTALITAKELVHEGYYGPAGFDHFVYTTVTGEECLAPVIEINGRHVMSHVAHAVRNQIAPGKYGFLRMISKKRCTLPQTYAEWNRLISGLNNVVLLTPLRICHDRDWVQPSRTALFIFADSESELFETDSTVRARIERFPAVGKLVISNV